MIALEVDILPGLVDHDLAHKWTLVESPGPACVMVDVQRPCQWHDLCTLAFKAWDILILLTVLAEVLLTPRVWWTKPAVAMHAHLLCATMHAAQSKPS